MISSWLCQPPFHFSMSYSRRVASCDSVYYLSAFSSTLHSKISHHLDDSVHPAGIYRDESQKAKMSTLNHLAALFMRGSSRLSPSKGEGRRVVAVAAGAVRVVGMDLFVASRDTGLTNPDHNENAFWTIAATDGFDLISDLAKEVDPEKPFHDFVLLGLRLLRSGAARIRTQPATALATMRAVTNFFVASCRSELQARFDALKNTYGLDTLKIWTPTEFDEIPSVEVKSTSVDSWAQKLLTEAGVQPSGEIFPFTHANASRWWTCLVRMLSSMDAALRVESSETADVERIAAISQDLRFFLRVIPKAMWKVDSLGEHLHGCRTSDSRKRSREIIDEEPELMFLPTADHDNIRRAMPEVHPFYRAIEAVCTWTTGPRYLLSSTMARSTAPLFVSLVDLPRQEIGEIEKQSADTLVVQWRDIAQAEWSEATEQFVRSKLPEFQADYWTSAATGPTTAAAETTTSSAAAAIAAASTPTNSIGSAGPCHCDCDTGVAASLLYFRQKGSPRQTDDETFTISTGAAMGKKRCAVCGMLVEILRANHGSKVHIGGAHTGSRFRAWVPPRWLPDEVVEELEKRLVGEVVRIANRHARWMISLAIGPDKDVFPDTERLL
ncbi:hypothetical protein C8R45DRAFT_1020948 [Mycena sanguinolenta]|nr:hypothetical protein C8R45DRAFT_1020948 [Mycena sanguinolenta]